MKQLLLLLCLVAASLAARAQPAAWTYATSSGVTAVATAADGTVYVAGTFAGSLQLGDTQLTSAAPGSCMFIARCTPGGHVVQATKLEGALSIRPNRLVVDADGNSYVAGSFFGVITYNGGQQTTSMDYTVFAGTDSAFLLKCSANGVVRWVQQGSSGGSGASFCAGRGVAVDQAGNSYFAGVVNGINIRFGALTFGQRRFHSFVASYDRLGQLRWARVLASMPASFGTSNVNGVAVDNAGGCYITGISIVGWVVDGVTLRAVSLPSTSGTLFLAKFSAQQGTALWAVPTPGQGTGQAIGVDKRNNVYTGGSFQDTATIAGRRLASAGRADGFVASYTARGAGRWATALGGPSDDQVNDLLVDPASSKVMATGGLSTPAGISHAFLQQLGPAGQLQRLELVGGPGASVGNVLASDEKDNLYLLGTATGRCLFGNIVLDVPATQGYLARYGSRQAGGNNHCQEFPVLVAAYPNPAQNRLALSVPNLPKALRATLYNQQGYALAAQTLPGGAAAEVAFDTGALPNGPYVLRLEVDGLTTTRLIAVQH